MERENELLETTSDVFRTAIRRATEELQQSVN